MFAKKKKLVAIISEFLFDTNTKKLDPSAINHQLRQQLFKSQSNSDELFIKSFVT
jgi:hypothetical protein